jgi:methyltransferase
MTALAIMGLLPRTARATSVRVALEGINLATLGERWTTRIIVLPGEPLVTKGPYRLIAHPNYAVVIGEIFVLPMAFGLVWYALLFSALNAAILFVRIRAENEVLTAMAGGAR